MEASYHRHDISNNVWSLMESLLPGRKGTWGGNARDNRLFINAVFWILRTGVPWRDYHLTMEIGKTLTGDSAGGVTKVFRNLS